MKKYKYTYGDLTKKLRDDIDRVEEANKQLQNAIYVLQEHADDDSTIAFQKARDASINTMNKVRVRALASLRIKVGDDS